MAFLYAFLLFTSVLYPKLCSSLDTITATTFIKDPEAIISSGGIYKLGFFSPQGSTNRYVGIWYNNIARLTVAWVANRNKPINDSSGICRISEDGNIQVLNGLNEVLWSSNVSNATANSTAQLLDSGNLVLQRALLQSNDSSNSSNIIWQSFDHPTNMFLPGMKAGIHNNTKQQLFRSWKSALDPSEGKFSVGIDPRVLAQVYTWNGDKPYWRSGPWNGNIMIGLPDANAAYFSDGFQLVDDADSGMIYITFSFTNKSLLGNYVLSPQGTITERYWDDGKQDWKEVWKGPSTECDVYGQCGDFGSCSSRNSPICSCLKGFIPKNQEEWRNKNWTSGCVRRTALKCNTQEGNRDGFLRLPAMKVPDHAEWWSTLFNQDDCKRQCLNNCSCLAYSYATGIGCMTWSQNLIDIQKIFDGGGVDLYIRMADSEQGNLKKAIILIAVLGFIGATIIIISIIFIQKKRAMRKAKKRNERMMDNENQAKLKALPRFTFRELVTATDSFAESKKLGQGGFGPVYFGKLDDGQHIAVKRLLRVSTSGQGQEEFMNEVLLISKLQHRNLVRLLGSCIEGAEQILVYEYMPNKSLDALLFDSPSRELLDWKKRLNIIEGISRGLLYLHRDSRLKIIHRDLKASNILLDDDLNPKISDFGLARIFRGNQDDEYTRRVIGTYGYMSPEYAMHGQFSEKSDVYSFGVLLLEIISGRRNKSFFEVEECSSLLEYVWKLWNDDGIIAIIDPTIRDTSFRMEILRCIHVGLLCVQASPGDRPNMSVVISMLDSEIAALPHPKEPAFIQQKSEQRTSSIVEYSMTSVTGR